MRKLILQVQISIDGFIAGTDGSTDWLVWDWGDEWIWDEELKKDFNNTIESIDCVLLSRKMAEGGFFAHWAKAAENPGDPRFAYARKLNDTRKVVFTKTLRESEWHKTDLANGALVDEVGKLKVQDGKDIIVYGGATFVSSLIRAGLIDEYQLFVNPTALGAGMTIFKEHDGKQNMTLMNSKSYDCGIVVLRYVAEKKAS